MARLELAERCAICGSYLWCNRQCVNSPRQPNKPIPTVTNTPIGSGVTNNAERQARKRERDPEGYRAYMRDLMRRKRAAEREQADR